MEAKIFENPCSPPSQSPDYFFNTTLQPFISMENHPEGPSITNLHTFNQPDIESTFSRLTLSPNFRSHYEGPPSFHGPPSTSNAVGSLESVPLPIIIHQPSFWAPPQSSNACATPSFLEHPSTIDAVASSESVSLPVTFGENHRSSFWTPAQRINASDNGPFGFTGAHQRINVGPEAIGFLQRSPFFHAGDHDRLMKIRQRQYFNGAGSDDFDYFTILHGKEPFSTNTFPVLPFSQQINFSSSRPSLYSNRQLDKWQQELTPEIMRGRIVSLAKDQQWSSILNLKLEEGLSEQEIEMFLPEVIEFSSDLLRNQFGSQFVQKLFAACNEDQRTRIIISLTRYPSKFINLLLNSYGARAIQKLLEKLITPQQISLVVSSLVPGAFDLSIDPNGQHVIHYCVKNFSSEYVKRLLIEIADNCYKIGTSKSGCCVLQSCVENSRGEARKRLISEIIANAMHLAEDPYGNYVVQHLLGVKMPEVTADLVRRFQGCFVSLSFNKYASNVVEKFLLLSGENHSTIIILEILKSPSASMLLLDPFGNFVIQSALSVSKGPVHDALVNLIQVNAPSMQSNIYGKKILAWFEKRKVYHA